MAKKPAKKTSKAMDKKSMKKTKGGILIGLNQPKLGTEFHKADFHKADFLKIQPSESTENINFWKI